MRNFKKWYGRWNSLPFNVKWTVFFILSVIVTVPGITTVISIFSSGLGILPLNNSIFWGTLIINFVFWIGVAHAGTFISAILLLLRQNWREEIHRFAEASTIAAVMIAAAMPLIHLGKPLYFYKIFPITERTSLLLLNTHSPITWDFFAIISYIIISVIFLYSGMLPEFAARRFTTRKSFSGLLWNYLSCGWTGSRLQWENLQKFHRMLAMIAAPLVIAVHSVVSYDFAVSFRTGWHNTIFPVYFVVGALMSGFAMILFWIPLVNDKYKNPVLISPQHLNNIAKIILACSVFLILVFINEWLTVISSDSQASLMAELARFKGNVLIAYLFYILFTLLLPQLFWIKKYRVSESKLQVFSLLILIGLWLERYVIVTGSLQVNPIHSATLSYYPNIHSLFLAFSPSGFFSVLILLIIRYLPLLQQDKKYFS